MRHVLTLFDLSPDEIRQIFTLAAELKAKLVQGIREPIYPGRVLAMLFQKQSLRTRVSFECAMAHLGGNSLFLGEDVGWGSRESVADFSRVLSEYVDLIVCRSKRHSLVAELAEHSTCPVINGLTDLAHPCQAITDLFTIQEHFGDLKNRKLTYVGDANNVARSLALCCAQLGVPFAIASPTGYQFDPAFLEKLAERFPAFQVEATTDPAAAVDGASAVYTDVWASMGQEDEREARCKAFADYQVDGKLMKHAKRDAIFLHCLPARRGEEVSAEVIDGPQSVIVQQAGNRLHAQKGLMAWLLSEGA
ncbi:ornithine carbamoyltransferase [Lignipirellula cremea]|uniref:Ornithine carbamoyltransferase n=1 Tax=Lignipirellula cremea TaxID=2528010 RepID=A0A518DWW2_9BACT|nr:ornithine carbamoyltransferase [Lignipirellula cremea]QDU96323.1 Ornithine carbamoyltransferase [Lignipirellula cremea]